MVITGFKIRKETQGKSCIIVSVMKFILSPLILNSTNHQLWFQHFRSFNLAHKTYLWKMSPLTYYDNSTTINLFWCRVRRKNTSHEVLRPAMLSIYTNPLTLERWNDIWDLKSNKQKRDWIWPSQDKNKQIWLR